MEFRQQALGYLRQYQFKEVNRLVQAQVFRQFRVNSADIANQLTIALNPSSLTWVQRRMLTSSECERALRTGKTKQGFDVGFYIVKVDRFPTVGPALA